MKSLLLIILSLVFMGESYLLQKPAFEVLLPNEPTYQKQMVDAGAATLELHLYLLEQGTSYYIVSHSYYPENIDLTDTERFFKGVINGMVSNYQGTLVSEQNITATQVIGKSVNVKLDDNNSVRVDYYLKGRTLYQLMVKADKSEFNNEQVKKYFASFKLK